MNRLLFPALLGLALIATPAFAHNGLIHEGCPTGQVFTAGDLTITGAYTRAMLPKAQVSGGYLTIENKGSSADRLLGGSTQAAKTVQVHQMKMEGDMMKMGEVEGGLEIPAGGTVALTPGGDAYHLMLMGVGTPFEEGQCLQLTLKFEKAGEVPVVLNIGGAAADAAPEGEMSMPMGHSDHQMAPAQ